MKSITIIFPEDHGILFNEKFEGQVHESQFEVAGRELIAIAEILRSTRLRKQLVVREEKKVDNGTGT